VVRDFGYRFVEVKSPYDELSQEQMRWFQWASSQNVSCEITRVKRLRQGEAASRVGMTPMSQEVAEPSHALDALSDAQVMAARSPRTNEGTR
jgi:hypothetical protein